MKLEEKIAQLRKRNGWSQEELAFRLNVSRQAVSKWEMGTSLPDLDNVLKMSELFDCSTDYLLKDEPTQAPVNENAQAVEEEPIAASKKSVWKAIEDLFWVIVLAIYLAWSFISGDWHITWILFPIAGVTFTVVESLVRLRKALKEQKNKK